MYKLFFYQCLRFFLIIMGLLSIYFLVKYMLIYFYPFLFAILFSYAINPVVTYAEQKINIPRIFATFTVICMLFLLIGGFSILAFTEIVQGTTYLAHEIPVHFQNIMIYIDGLLTNKIIPLYEQFTALFNTLNETQQSTIADQFKQLITQVSIVATESLSDLLLKIPSILTMIPYSIAMFLFTIMATFFITNDWDALRELFKSLIPNHLKNPGRNLIVHFFKAFTGFLKAQIILISISVCITITGLLILKVDHALTITLLIAFVDLLPLLGTGIVFIPWIGYLFLMENYPLTIGLTILYMIIIISRQILEPKILAVNIGINPLVALVTVFISIQFWGFMGIIVAPLVLILINVFYKSGLIKQVWFFIKGA